MSATPRRSDSTRAAILAAARERFATDGYERATIRAIAADAGIDPSMVMRYYGSKDKLFATAADFDLHLPDPSQVPREQIATMLVTHFLKVWEGDETFQALLRAAATNESAAQRIREIFGTQLGPAVASIVTDPGEASTRAGLLATQMLGFALCRYVLRLPPVVSLSQEAAVAWLAPTVQRYLTSDAA
ncbi:TetR/AcrR family transcriptional regulator [Micromonospora sp. NPDC003197]